MAHNIDTMFYAGAKPWHGLGTKVEKELTSLEAIKAAGLDWTVSKHAVPHPISGVLSDRFFQVMRDDSQEVFACGKSSDFTIFQNRKAFTLGDDILGTKQASFHTAGALGKGEKVWMLMKLPKDIRIAGTDDLTGAYLLITNCHDGSGSLRVMVTFIRVVCQNTLLAALGAARDVYNVIHYGNMKPKIDDVRNVLKMSSEQFKSFHSQANVLAARVMQRAQVDAILNALIPLREDGAEEDMPFRVRHHDNIKALFEDNDGGAIKKVAGTSWAFYNAITRYVDFHKQPFGFPEKVAPIEKRAPSLLFGEDAKLKRRALELTLKMTA